MEITLSMVVHLFLLGWVLGATGQDTREKQICPRHCCACSHASACASAAFLVGCWTIFQLPHINISSFLSTMRPKIPLSMQLCLHLFPSCSRNTVIGLFCFLQSRREEKYCLFYCLLIIFFCVFTATVNVMLLFTPHQKYFCR